ncbi:MAG TPA: hypothetical protein VH370_21365 [Humisphaera sp.]|nr:hypothetical protein [Humisphaera sp.]
MQDQDLLGCGEADPTLLEEALRKQADANSGALPPQTVADLLAQWTKSLARQNSPWAAPIWFVEGFLRGCEFMGLEEEPPAPRPKPVLGLHHVSLDVPKEMKTKLYNGGIELKNREAQIIVCEWDDGSYRVRLEQLQMPRLEAPAPHLREEIEPHFTIGGGTSCVKYVLRNLNSGKTAMCTYFLEVASAKIEVSIFARKSDGADIEKYEYLIGTIRPKETA